jgi:hypothetical protein
MSDSNKKLSQPLQEGDPQTANGFKHLDPVSSPSPERRRTYGEDTPHGLSLSNIYIDNISSHRMDKDMQPIPGLDQTRVSPVVLDVLDIPFESNRKICILVWEIFYQGLMGAVVFLLLLGGLLAVIIIAGRLEDPAAKVSAMGIGISWLGIFSGVIWGLNMGFQTIAFRCIGLGEFAMLKRYLVRQHKIVAVFALVFLFVVALLYWVAGYQYENKPEVLEKFRNFLLVAAPAMLVIYFTDVIRQLHFGMNCYVGACVCESLCFMYVIFWGWFLGLYMGYGMWGILSAFAISEISGYAGYLINFLFNKDFYDIPIFFNKKKALKKRYILFILKK